MNISFLLLEMDFILQHKSGGSINDLIKLKNHFALKNHVEDDFEISLSLVSIYERIGSNKT